MGKLTVIAAVFLLLTAPVVAQQPDTTAGLTLARCYELVREHYPLSRQQALTDQQTAATVDRLRTQRLLPQLTLNGQASYQSEVTRVPVDLPGLSIPTVSPDQYRLTVDASEILYDGGLTQQQQTLAALNGQVSQQQLEVTLYRLREQVENLFFGVLLTDETTRLRENLRADLQQRRTALENRRRYGAATGQELHRLDAELLTLTQQLSDLQLTRRQLLTQLGTLLGQPVSAETKLLTPSALPPPSARPEWTLYERQRALLAGQTALQDAQLRPRLNLFGQAGYGRPGLDFLRNDFHAFGIGGVRLSWNLGGYYTRRQDRALTRMSAEAVTLQQQTFELNQQLDASRREAELERYFNLLATDHELIELREEIRATAAVQLENGIIGFTDYFTEANNLTQARLNQQLHRLQLLQAQAALLTSQGQLLTSNQP